MSLRWHAEDILVVLAVSALIGCGGDSNAAQLPSAKREPVQPKPQTATKQAPASSRGYVDGGDSMRFVSHDENLPVGFPSSARALMLTNPYEGDKRALGIGAQLFVAYNCVDCHGADGSGAMGPAFADGRWHFGGSPGEVFESIYEGRPDGMPQWGGRISNDQIWMLTSYVRSLATKDLSTENFTGTTIERTGH